MKELTDTERKELTTRLFDLRTQAKDLWFEICQLQEDLCVHEFVDLSPETSQCKHCHKVCHHDRLATLTKECGDCHSKLIYDLAGFRDFVERIQDGRPTR